MTRALSVLAACLAIACVVLGALLIRANNEAAVIRAGHQAQVAARQAELTEAKAAVRVATSSAVKASQALEDARSRLEAAKVTADARVYVERVREVQTLSETPSADGARASLEAAGVETTETATLALTWAAMARWRRLHAEAETRAEVLAVEVGALRAEVVAVRAIGGANEAKLREDVSRLDVALAEAEARESVMVSPSRRTVSAVSMATLAAGVAVASMGLALCRSSACREVTGLGGGGAAVAGGIGLVAAW